MIVTGMRTGDKGIQPLYSVSEALFYKEVQRPIGDGRLRGKAVTPENFKDVVSAKGAVLAQKDLQHFSPDRRQLRAIGAAMRVCRRNTGGDALRMVVMFETDHHGLICYIITHIKL